MFNKPATYYKAITIAALWLAILPVPLAAQSDGLSEKIWAGIGGKHNWDNARYFMFTCQASTATEDASYLWDRQTGNCRFEGSTSDNQPLVVLFNLNDGHGEVFIDDVQQADEGLVATKVANVSRRFQQDAALLFLPTIQDGKNATVSLESERLVGSSRQLIAHVKTEETACGTPMEGTAYVDAQNGRIRQWHPRRGTSYEVSGYKDIGGGLILPTRFSAQQGNRHVMYPVAANLVHIEPEKFSQP